MLTPILAALLAGTLPPLGTAAVAGTPRPSRADPAPVISYMDVEIWPEYDEPRVLLIYKGSLVAPGKTPTDFTFVIPDGAHVHMVGGVDANGQHIHATYQTHKRADGLVELTYRLTVPDFYMEFYYNPLGGAAQRRFTYTVLSPFVMDTLVVAVQEPQRAQDFTISPLTEQVSQDRNGFNYYVLQYDGVKAGARKAVTVAYRKTDDQPSIASPGDATSSATPPAAPGGHRTAIAILALVALVSAGFGLWPLVRPRIVRGRADVGARESASRPETGAARFCTQCGESLSPDDRYCARCGAPTRALRSA